MSLSEDIKTLREQTGAGMLDCKKALEQNDGNMDKAADWHKRSVRRIDNVCVEGTLCQYGICLRKGRRCQENECYV